MKGRPKSATVSRQSQNLAKVLNRSTSSRKLGRRVKLAFGKKKQKNAIPKRPYSPPKVKKKAITSLFSEGKGGRAINDQDLEIEDLDQWSDVSDADINSCDTKKPKERRRPWSASTRYSGRKVTKMGRGSVGKNKTKRPKTAVHKRSTARSNRGDWLDFRNQPSTSYDTYVSRCNILQHRGLLDQVKYLKSQLKDKRDEIYNLKEEIGRLGKRYQALNNNLQKVKGGDQRKIARLKSQLSTLKINLRNLTGAKNVLEKQLGQRLSPQNAANLRENIKVLASENERLKSDADRAQVLQAQLGGMKKALEVARKNGDDTSALRQQIDGLEQALKEAQNRYQSVEQKFNQRNAEFEKAAQQIEVYKKSIKDSRRERQVLLEEVEGLKENLALAQKNGDRAALEVLKGQLKLKSQQLEKSEERLLQLTSKIDNISSQLAKYEARDKKGQEREQELQKQLKMQQLELEKLRKQGVDNGTQRNLLESKYAKLQKEHRLEIEGIRRDYEALITNMHNNHERRTESIRREIEALNQRNKSLISEKEKLERNLQILNDDQGADREKIKNLNAQLSSLVKTIEGYKLEKEILTHRLDSANKLAQYYQEELENNQATIYDLSSRINELQERELEYQIEEQRLQSQIANLVDSVGDRETKEQELRKNLDKVSSQRQSDISKIDFLTKQLSAKEKQNTELVKKIKEFETESEVRATKENELHDIINNLQLKLKEEKDKRESDEERVRDLELEMHQATKKYEEFRSESIAKEQGFEKELEQLRKLQEKAMKHSLSHGPQRLRPAPQPKKLSYATLNSLSVDGRPVARLTRRSSKYKDVIRNPEMDKSSTLPISAKVNINNVLSPTSNPTIRNQPSNMRFSGTQLNDNSNKFDQATLLAMGVTLASGLMLAIGFSAGSAVMIGVFATTGLLSTSAFLVLSMSDRSGKVSMLSSNDNHSRGQSEEVSHMKTNTKVTINVNPEMVKKILSDGPSKSEGWVESESERQEELSLGINEAQEEYYDR